MFDFGLILFLTSFFPSDICEICKKEISFWDYPYLIRYCRERSGIEKQCYCSKKCAITI